MKKTIFLASILLLMGCTEGSESRVPQTTTTVTSGPVDEFPEEQEYEREEINSSETRTVWKRKTYGEFSVEKIEYCYFDTVNPRFSSAINSSSEDGTGTCNWEFFIQRGTEKWSVDQNVTAYEADMDIRFVDVTGDGIREFEIVDSGSDDGVGSATRYFQLGQGKWQKLFFAPANSVSLPVQKNELVDFIPNDLGTDGGPPEIKDGLLLSYGQGPCDPPYDSNMVFFRWNGKYFEVDHWDYDGEIMKPSRNPQCPDGYTLRR